MANSDLKKIAINYGVIMGVISVVSAVVQYALGDYNPGARGQGSWVWSVIGFAIIIIIPILAMNKFKALQNGFMTFKEGFKLGFSIFIYSALITVVWMAVYLYALEPGYQETILEQTAEQMYEQNPDISAEQEEMTLSMTEKFTSPIAMLIWTIVMSAIIGAVISLILTAILKKNPPEYAG